MKSPEQHRTSAFDISLRAATAAIAIVSALIVVATPVVQAQTYSVIYNFPGRAGGAFPEAGLTIDARGSLYGTTAGGGTGNGNGTVFKLTQKLSGWVSTPLYAFAGGNDGFSPQSGVVFGPNGSLYGTTTAGGVGCGSWGCGTVFNLRPPATACKAALCPWAETVLYRFEGGNDGATPASGDVVFDQEGSLYGTTTFGGTGNNCTGTGCGAVYKLTPSGSGWTECVIYSFSGGAYPNGVIFDNAADLLYGTTSSGNMYDGEIFQLTPSGCSSTERLLYGFDDGTDGGFPEGGVIFDPAGNLYGTTSDGGPGHGGTVFELIKHNNGGFSFSLIYGFTASQQFQFQGPFGSLVMDAAGNLYGTTYEEGLYGEGTVFELMLNADSSWTYKDLHDFDGSDGANPVGNVILDANGNIYGTASEGGRYGSGVAWEITP